MGFENAAGRFHLSHAPANSSLKSGFASSKRKRAALNDSGCCSAYAPREAHKANVLGSGIIFSSALSENPTALKEAANMRSWLSSETKNSFSKDSIFGV